MRARLGLRRDPGDLARRAAARRGLRGARPRVPRDRRGLRRSSCASGGGVVVAAGHDHVALAADLPAGGVARRRQRVGPRGPSPRCSPPTSGDRARSARPARRRARTVVGARPGARARRARAANRVVRAAGARVARSAARLEQPLRQHQPGAAPRSPGRRSRPCRRRRGRPAPGRPRPAPGSTVPWPPLQITSEASRHHLGVGEPVDDPRVRRGPGRVQRSPRRLSVATTPHRLAGERGDRAARRARRLGRGRCSGATSDERVVARAAARPRDHRARSASGR